MSTSSRLRHVAPAAVPARRRLSDRSRAAVAVMGELLMTAGVVILLYAVYVLYGTGLQTAQAQTELRNDLTRTWAAPSPQAPPAQPAPAPAPRSAAPTAQASAPVPPSRGEAVALLRLPRFGDYEKVVVEGTDRPELKKGPGHQPGTAMPGQLGNVVLAGHRTT